ncbi:Response regulator HsfA [Desulfamplus magnetovallimortis]|uniref:Response regulator HsfA n=1 Tax=Desulfamplus magnetovallimortis TaxID=1246637 RepID=A0A1W1HAZ8_9BACT|nr:sigma-54 dependent transcriptional regulator [Desulfamplus magnetovallimortis]SLM29592.1 Response regulator HsfA [Desulfamplus magnetovallimortis]
MLDFHKSDIPVVFVDDEQSELDAYSFLLQSMGVKKIITIKDSRSVMATLESLLTCVVFLDLNMPQKSGKEVLQELKVARPHIPVVICTANSDIETAVECLKLGAHDYLVKPINMNTFGSALRNALEISTLRQEVMNLKGFSLSQKLNHPEYFREIITKSPAMFTLFHYIEAIAPSGQPVLILGETGSGKELTARAIHDASGVTGDFVVVDVSGLDDPLFSDTLFGHKRGAYTGAEKDRPGLIKKANNGTLFLDEIGDLTKVSQIKLLRLVQEGLYYPLGSDQPKTSSTRIITATNKKLNHQVHSSEGAEEENSFRMDLFYRLSTHLLILPPLRERTEDIPLLVEHFKAKAADQMNREVVSIADSLIAILSTHPFPGNIRELKTYIFDAVARCTTRELTENDILDRLKPGMGVATKLRKDCAIDENSHKDQMGGIDALEYIFGGFPTLNQLTEYGIDQALKRSGNNQSKAAGMLGISKQALSKRLKKRRK